MSAELLRAAAAKMRERAEAATPGPWYWEPNFGTSGDTGLALAGSNGAEVVGAYNYHCWDDPRVSDEDALHIASWHPAVALAVADWLDATARELDSLGDPDLSSHPLDGRRTAALAVARAYLGSDV